MSDATLQTPGPTAKRKFRGVRHPRLNWLARWCCGIVVLLCVSDFWAAGRFEYFVGPGVAGPIVYVAGGRVVSVGWSLGALENPRRMWFQAPYVKRLTPLEMRYWKWQWWPNGQFREGWGSQVGTAGGPLPFLSAPTWVIALIAAGLSGVAWRTWWRDRHRRRGMCFKCGYDRAGLRHGVACSECGTPPVS
jgi:hypothetical protein